MDLSTLNSKGRLTWSNFTAILNYVFFRVPFQHMNVLLIAGSWCEGRGWRKRRRWRRRRRQQQVKGQQRDDTSYHSNGGQMGRSIRGKNCCTCPLFSFVLSDPLMLPNISLRDPIHWPLYCAATGWAFGDPWVQEAHPFHVYMWYDQAKSVISQCHSILSFPHDLKLHQISYILLKTHQNRTFSSRDTSKCRFSKTIGNKEVVFFDGLYLKINIVDKRLIQLDYMYMF